MIERFNTIDGFEIMAIKEFITNPDVVLSGYIGSKPYGGSQVLSLEGEWSKAFGIKYSVAVNSATSGLLAACMAVGVQTGDEVIVSPYTMSATAAAPKLLGAKLVFCDIEDETYGLDVIEVANAITSKTKAVIVTNLFGHPAQIYELRKLCDEHGVYLIEDNAQGVFARESIVYAGCMGHIGVFSLNVHKQLQTGEGGVCVTNDRNLSGKLREAMNHGEMRGGIIGLNLRMPEIIAVMARVQLKKGEEIVKSRVKIGEMISSYVKSFELPIKPPVIRHNCEHSYYVWAGQLTDKAKEGPVTGHFRRGYMRPLYEMPAFKQDIHLPVVEEVEKRMILCEVCSIDPTQEEIAQMMLDLKKEIT